MLREMSASEWGGWLAYMSVDPFGPARDDYRTGVLYSLIANLFGRGKNAPAHKWTDMFPEHRLPAAADDPAAARLMFERAMAVGRSLGFAPPAKPTLKSKRKRGA